MQNYCGNPGDYMRRGNQGRNSKVNSCQQMVSASSCVCESMNIPVEQVDVLEGLPITMAYVPWQSWKKIICPEKALHIGTIFEELNKPFLGMGGCR